MSSLSQDDLRLSIYSPITILDSFLSPSLPHIQSITKFYPFYLQIISQIYRLLSVTIGTFHIQATTLCLDFCTIFSTTLKQDYLISQSLSFIIHERGSCLSPRAVMRNKWNVKASIDTQKLVKPSHHSTLILDMVSLRKVHLNLWDRLHHDQWTGLKSKS